MEYPAEWETVFMAKNGMRVDFRPKKSGDTEMLWNMFSTLSKDSVSNLIPPFTRERIEGWTSNINYDDVLTIVAVIKEEKKHRIVGSASLSFNPHEHSKHKAGLSITVHDQFQNMGLGTALVKHLMDIAKMKRLGKVWLQVTTDNDVAIHIYKKAGFRIEGKLLKERCINGRYRDEYRMAILI
jgi:putative acetyltransferase